MRIKHVNYWKVAFTVFLAWYFGSYALGDPSHVLANWNFVDNVDLVIHEAGHIIFMPFGEFLHVLGGSLTQVLVPVIFAAYFFMRRQWYSASVMLFWIGENVLSVATYMGDSIVQQLPLLGGDGVIHDWNWLLTDTGLLKYTDTLARLTYDVGFLAILAAIVLCLWLSVEKPEKVRPIDL